MKRLYRSNQNKMIAGVCGGIAEYFDIDPTVVRIAWVILSLVGALGILSYVICLVLMPENPSWN